MKIRKELLLTCLFVLLFGFFLAKNSLNYKVLSEHNKISVILFDHKIELFSNPKSESTSINLYPQERYSTSQYLIEDQNLISNSTVLIRRLFTRKHEEIKFYHKNTSSISLLHFNPFRASLIFANEKDNRRLEINIPDASLELWSNNDKLNSYTIKPPWLQLILIPVFTSLSLAVALAYFLNLLIKKRTEAKKVYGYKTGLSDHTIALGVLIVGSIVIGLIFFKVFYGMPGFGDEMNYLIQAKIFSSGNYYLPEPPLTEFFQVSWMDVFGPDKRLWNFHPPGNSLILLIGQFLKIEWITVPLIGGLILAVQYYLALTLFRSRAFALIHVLVILTSHYFLTLASSYMAHAPSLLFISISYLFLIRFFSEKRNIFLLISAVCFGVSFTIRPVSAALSAIVPMVAVLLFLIKNRLKYLDISLLSLLAGFIISLFVFFYSYQVSGQFTLPYLIKGPEAGKTLSDRWSEDWNYKLTNLYRNSNEFQNRVHNLGYIFNIVFFLFPLLGILKDRYKWLLLAGYISFTLYIVLHSFLHWYGWKWEPRMIYDISFIFFLLSTYGLYQIYLNLKSDAGLKLTGILIFIAFTIYTALHNLPYRFKNEYLDYNISTPGVKTFIKENNIENAIIFFRSEKEYAPYTPFNDLNFGGSIIYALSQDDDYDYKLITKYPDKDIYYSDTGKTLVKKTNFYQQDIKNLAEDLKRNYQNKNIIIVLPWLEYVEPGVNSILPGTIIDSKQLINRLLTGQISETDLLLLVDTSTEIEKIIPNFFTYQVHQNTSLQTENRYLQLQSKIELKSDKIPFFRMNCYRTDTPEKVLIIGRLVTSVDNSDCPGENRYAEWTSFFILNQRKRVAMFLDSDDRSAITVDNLIVLEANQNGEQVTEIELEEGTHRIVVEYENGPGRGFLKIGLLNQNLEQRPLTIDDKTLNYYLPRELWN